MPVQKVCEGVRSLGSVAARTLRRESAGGAAAEGKFVLDGVAAAAAAGAPRGSISITVPCGDAFDERLKWLLSLSDAGGSPLLRVEEIGPADSPRYARVAGAGTSLWLSREHPALPLTLRVAAEPSAAPAPAGCEAVAVAAVALAG